MHTEGENTTRVQGTSRSREVPYTLVLFSYTPYNLSFASFSYSNKRAAIYFRAANVLSNSNLRASFKTESQYTELLL
jgi:hypothetical protein